MWPSSARVQNIRYAWRCPCPIRAAASWASPTLYITDAFEALLKGKNTAILTGIYTGAGRRDWVFYTFSTEVFNSFLNKALASFPQLPLSIYAENDPEWLEYDEMREATTM